MFLSKTLLLQESVEDTLLAEKRKLAREVSGLSFAYLLKNK